MDLVIFEQNKPLVLEGLEQGEFDYIDAASEVFETEFFRYINAKKILESLAETYPTPRKKEEVPLWFYIASNLSMRLHGAHSFHAFPMIVRAGGMLNAFGPDAGRKVKHPETEDVTLACTGFNNKNHYDRQTPCDQDTLRKLARDTDAEALMGWFGGDVVREFRKRRVFDKEGIFIGDASYLFVPDNPNYEGSDKLLFDKHNHPVSREAYEKMSDAQKTECQWRRCYKMVTLLHTNRSRDFFLFAGLKVVPGKKHECPLFYQLVEEFVQGVGKGVIKLLILDRGFLDGKAISRCKSDLGIDVLIPIRRNMDIYEDAKILFQQSDVPWTRYAPRTEKPVSDKPPRPKPKAVVKREQKRQKKLEELKQKLPPPPPEKTDRAVSYLVLMHGASERYGKPRALCRRPLQTMVSHGYPARTPLCGDSRRLCDPYGNGGKIPTVQVLLRHDEFYFQGLFHGRSAGCLCHACLQPSPGVPAQKASSGDEHQDDAQDPAATPARGFLHHRILAELLWVVLFL
jgi:hypothetical protein